MSVKKNKFISIINISASPLIVFATIFLYFYVKDMYPFGPNTLAWLDMKQQVVPLMLQWKEIVYGNNSLILNMLGSGGGSFLGIFFFFISSPFSILILFVSDHDSVLFMNILVAIKIAVSGLTATYMFRKLFSGLSVANNLVLSIAYAFCGFSLMFFQNLIWLDFVILFPLLLVGLDELFSKGKQKIYFSVLILMLFTSYYLSYMIALFLIIYAVFNLSHTSSENRTASKMLLSSVAALGTASVVWLPSLNEYLVSARSVGIIESLQRGSFLTPYETTSGVIFSTSLLMVIFPLIFSGASKKSHPGGRSIIIFFLILIPVFIEPINKVWHTGSYQAFPARYGYIPVLIGLSLIASYLEKEITRDLGPVRKKRMILFKSISSILCIAAVVLVIFFTNNMLKNKLYEISRYARTLWGDHQSFILLFTSFLVFGAVYFFLITLKRFGFLPKAVYSLLIISLLLTENFFNLEVYVGTPSNNADQYKEIFDLADRIEDDRFYRVKSRRKYFDVNMTGALGYNSLSTYTSLTPEKYLFTMKKLGFSSYWMEVGSTHGTGFIDALFAQRYEISSVSDESRFSDSLIYSNEKFRLSRKPSLDYPALILDRDQYDILRKIDINERIIFQNIAFKTITGEERELFVDYPYTGLGNIGFDHSDKYNITRLDGEDPSIYYDVYIKDRQILYFDCFDHISASLVEGINNSISIFVNGESKCDSYPDKNSNGILELGEFNNEYVSVRVKVNKNFSASSFGLYGMDCMSLENAIDYLNSSKDILSFTHSGNEIGIEIDATSDMSFEGSRYLAVFVPNNSNFTAYTDDGRLIPVMSIMDAFVAVEITPEVKSIKLVSSPKGYHTGLLISIVSAFLILFYALFRRTSLTGNPMCIDSIISVKTETVIRKIIIAVGAVIVAAVYILPVLIYIFSTLLL